MLLLVAFAALVGSGHANYSPFCGRWVSTCVPEATSGTWINTTLSTQAYSYPNGSFPTVDYEGTYGSYAYQQQVYNASTCGAGTSDLVATVFRFGDWVDQGPAINASLFRQILFNPTSMKIKPATNATVDALKQLCPCNPTITNWTIGLMVTVTACTGACEIPWVNYSNVGALQYGLARYSEVTQTLNLTAFTATPFPIPTPPAVLFTYAKTENCTAIPAQTELCGTYAQECRANNERSSNVKVALSLFGNDVGSFNLAYYYYALDDTSCTTEFVASASMSGTYALHGPTNCSGSCQGAQALEVFASSTTIKPGTQAFTDNLNTWCPCNGTWVLSQTRTITVCPLGTCQLASHEFSHGIPIGTIKEAYANVIGVGENFLALTQFSEVNDYAQGFGVNDHIFVGGYTPDCAAGKFSNELQCGQYVSLCQGSADRTANIEENTTFFGPGLTGEFRRVYRQYPFNDRFCSGPANFEYILTGTYNLADQGTYSKVEVSITRSQFTLFTSDALDAFKLSCRCSYGVAWALGVPTIITTCDPNFGCDIGTFPGIDGLNIGTVDSVYGNLAFFDTFVALTDFSLDMPTGFANSFTADNPILFQSTQFTCPQVGPYPVCGVYHDGCRGGAQEVDNDNLVRSLTLFGEQFGDFTIAQYMYQAFDSNCTDTNLNGIIEVYGTFALHGPSSCGGSCPGVGAQQIELSITYMNIVLVNPGYFAAFEALCPCNGTWTLDQPRIIAECPPGTCNVDIRGLQLGTSAPAYGSLLRFGTMATTTMFNPSAAAGYSLGFTSQDQALIFDPSTVSTTCPAVDMSSFCGVYESECAGYGDDVSLNTIETVSFDGASSGSFRRTFKSYSAAVSSRCSTIVIQNWDMQGTFVVTGPSTCGGSCIYANATTITITSATIILTSATDVANFNSKCSCGGQWVVGQPRTITSCDLCNIYNTSGAHGLHVGGNPSFGSVTFAAGRLAMTFFQPSPSLGYSVPFEPATDRVFVSNPTAATGLLACAGAASPGKASSSSGLSAGDGLLIAFFCIVGVYVIGGMALNYRAGASGPDLVPHYSFWKTLPGMVGDGFRFAFLDCFGYRGNSVAGASSSSSSYAPVSGRGGYGAM